MAKPPAGRKKNDPIYLGVDKHGNQKWQARVYDPTKHAAGLKNDKRARTFYATGLAAARRENERVRSELRAEVEAAVARADTIAHCVERWLHHGGRKWTPGTRRVYQRIGSQIIADLGNIRAADLNALHVDDWLDTIANRPGISSTPDKPTKVSPRTVAQHRAVIRAMLRQAEKWGLVDNAKAATNSAPPTVTKRPGTQPTTPAVSVLLEGAAPTLRAAIAIGVYAGLREGEIAGLRWSDFDGNTITVRRSITHDDNWTPVAKLPKSDSGQRVVQVDPALWSYLAVIPRPASGDAYVFPDWRKDPNGQVERHGQWIAHAWRQHRKKHGADRVRFHDLRHWYVTTLLHSGVPLPQAQALAGHSNPSTTMGYAHANPTAALEAARAIGSQLSNRTGEEA